MTFPHAHVKDLPENVETPEEQARRIHEMIANLAHYVEDAGDVFYDGGAVFFAGGWELDARLWDFDIVFFFPTI